MNRRRFHLNARPASPASMKLKHLQATEIQTYAMQMREKLLAEYPDWRVRFADAIRQILERSSMSRLLPLPAAIELLNAQVFDPAIKGLVMGIGMQLSIDRLTDRPRPFPPPANGCYADEIEDSGDDTTTDNEEKLP